MPSSLEEFIEQFKQVSDLLTDSYFIVDTERTIIDFNHHFYKKLPRASARQLKGKHCYDVITLDVCANNCIGQQCWEKKSVVRLNEINGTVVGETAPKTFILSAMPILDDSGVPLGAVEIQRDVTDVVDIQGKYRTALDKEAAEREQMSQTVQTRTKQLMDVNKRLIQTQKELLEYKRRLIF